MITTIEEIENFFTKHKDKKLDVRIHYTIGGAECYRVVTADGTPLVNIQKRAYKRFEEKQQWQGIKTNG